MKEITRIHLAKTPYEIEIDAKKAIEQYLQSIANYSQDEEQLADIEIRITEILSDRNVQPNNVITMVDVDAIKQQLGQPADFLDESASSTEEPGLDIHKKLYRDINAGIAGGVIAGVARFTGLNVLLLRAIALLLIIVSSGFGIIIYLAIWLIMPPAKTAAQRLAMTGQSATLGSMRQLSETDLDRQTEYDTAARLRKTFRSLLAVIFALGAVVTGGITIAAPFIFGTNRLFEFNVAESGHVAYSISYGLLIAAGALLSILLAIIAYMFGKATITRRLSIVAIVVICLGLISAGSALAVSAYQQWRSNDTIRRSIVTKDIAVPEGFASIKQLILRTPNVEVSYIVSNTPRISYETVPSAVPLKIMVNGGVANIAATSPTTQPLDIYIPGRLTIYGPALDTLTTAELSEQGDIYGTNVSYEGKAQSITVNAARGTNITLSNGTYEQLTVTLASNASLSAGDANVRRVIAQLGTGAGLDLANVNSLTATVPDACPNYAKATLTVSSIADNTILVNNAVMPLKNQSTNCYDIVVPEAAY